MCQAAMALAVPLHSPTLLVASENHCRVINAWVPMATKCCFGLQGPGHCQVQAELTPCSLLDIARAKGSSPMWGDELRAWGPVPCPSCFCSSQRQSQAKTFSDALLHPLLPPGMLPCSAEGSARAAGAQVGLFLTPSRDPNPAHSPRQVDVCLCQRACPTLRVGEAELSQEC